MTKYMNNIIYIQYHRSAALLLAVSLKRSKLQPGTRIKRLVKNSSKNLEQEDIDND